jgi:hypothetical protein
VIIIGEDVYAKLAPRRWLRRPLESEIHERWLDDAAHAARDAIELAGPRLQLGELTEIEHEGRRALRMGLGMNDERDSGVIPNRMGAEWRHAAQLEDLGGEIVLDEASGAWLELELHVTWTMQDAESRPLRGVLDIRGSTQPVEAAKIRIEAPPEAVDLPERERLQLERDRLLDGLAGR